jgi:hypothetical protein
MDFIVLYLSLNAVNKFWIRFSFFENAAVAVGFPEEEFLDLTLMEIGVLAINQVKLGVGRRWI